MYLLMIIIGYVLLKANDSRECTNRYKRAAQEAIQELIDKHNNKNHNRRHKHIKGDSNDQY